MRTEKEVRDGLEEIKKYLKEVEKETPLPVFIKYKIALKENIKTLEWVLNLDIPPES